MSLLNWFENKFAGELIADYGPLSTDAQGLLASASLRQKPDGTRYLVFKWEGKSTLRWVDFQVTPALLDRLSAIVQDARARLGAA
ncbi:MAG TPA: hypothetical protein VM716_03440 [Gemmatimonadales bacterium]|nr:hypothetical protein [Gemmatimonadales bacterium]